MNLQMKHNKMEEQFLKRRKKGNQQEKQNLHKIAVRLTQAICQQQ